jgi:hypothetical protein
VTARPLAIVLAALCGLLAVTAFAHAESAWVLWGQTLDPWGALAAFPLGRWPSREACEQERARREQEPREQQMASYSCLPDSADPRRPKGK